MNNILFERANSLFSLGLYNEAARIYKELAASGQDVPRASHGLAVVLFHQGKEAEAVDLINEVLRLKPDYADAYLSLGNILLKCGQVSKAIAAYRSCLELKSDHALAWNNLGNALNAHGDINQALSCYQRAAECGDEEHAIVQTALLLTESFKYDEAASILRAGLKIFPESAKITLALIKVLHCQQRNDEALALYERSRSLVDDLPERRKIIAEIYRQNNNIDGALALMQEDIKMNPLRTNAGMDIFFAMYQAGRHDEAIHLIENCTNYKVSQQYNYLSAYQYALTMIPDTSEQEILDVACRFASSLCATLPHIFSPRPDESAGISRPYRIGYVSPDFGCHPVGYHILPILLNHDSAAFQIFCYNNRGNEDDVTIKIKNCVSIWRNVKNLSDEQLADVVRHDAIDILVDLAGHSANHRLRMFAMRPAPLQVSWLGYWATTGLEAIDYTLSDETTIPYDSERFFVERIWRLPGCRFCYCPPEYSPDVASLPALSNGYITFGSFNNVSKLNEGVIKLWAEVLSAIPASRLVLKWKTFSDTSVCERFANRFADYGISAERLHLRPASIHADMLAEYGDIDIALDPFPFSGGMTSCEALWMGVPVITMPGSRAVSRQTAAYLATIGLEGFTTSGDVEYVATAVSWSKKLYKLSEVRACMRKKMQESTLCDGRRFTKNLEQAYLDMFAEVRQRTDQISGEDDPSPDVDLEQLFPEDSYNEAMSLFNQGLLEQARARLEAAIRGCNHVALWHNDLGNVIASLGLPDEAMSCYREAIRLNDLYPEAHYNLGLELQCLGRLDEALIEYKRALDIYPEFLPAQLKLNDVLNFKNNAELSCSTEARVLELYNSANLAQDSGNLSRAQQLYEECLITAPGFALALNNLGIVLASSGDIKAARQRFLEAIDAEPANPDPYNNLGRLLMAQNDYVLAAASFSEALLRDPDHADALSNFSYVYSQTGQISLAIESAEKTLKIKPDFADANINLGRAWINAGDVVRGVNYFREAIKNAPLKTDFRSNLIYALHYIPSGDSELLREMENWKQLFTNVPVCTITPRINRKQRLRVGFVSPDMGLHPVGIHLLPVLRHIDHTRLQIFSYSDRYHEDALGEELRSYTDVWRQTRHLSNEALAGLIVSDDIDILIDLAGHTANNRLNVFAMKPARIQVSWLGYWGTTGLGTMDYVVSDNYTVPKGAEQYFDENVVRLPGCRFCYSPPDYAPVVAALPALSNGYITFGCFNNIAKLNEDVVTLWADVLKAIPDARLVLKWKTLADPFVKNRFITLFKKNGIDQDRLELRGGAPHDVMLSEYGDIDIALDPFPNSGGMTTCEALWMGVPVLTLVGNRPVSRQTFAYLKTVGLDGFDTYNREEFVSRAVDWSRDLENLQLIRSRLRAQMLESLLCNGEAFARNLEQVFFEIAARYSEVAQTHTLQKSVLNVGGGSKSIAIPPWYKGWRHLLLDIDPAGSPDIVADARDLFHLESASIDAVYCSHNLEHYFRHHAVQVLQGFRHVLKHGGFLDIRVPDLKQVMQQVVSEGLDLDDVLYVTANGSNILVHDVLYGWGRQIEESGEEFYAHRCGFTEPSLCRFLHTNGFPYVATRCRIREVQAFAFISPPDDALLSNLGISRSDLQSAFCVENNSSQKIDQAHTSWEEGDYKRAVALCESILEDDQECVDAYLILGEYSLQNSDTDDAVSYFRIALLFDPDSLQGIIGLLRSFEQSGDVEEYQSCLAEAKERFPELEALHDNK